MSRRRFIVGAMAMLAGACTTAVRRAARNRAPTTTTMMSTNTVETTSPSTTSRSAVAQFIDAGPRSSTAAALTFHGSGDPALTTQLLAIAARLRVPITVFAVGQWLEQHADMAPAILAGGHELANHTYTHPVLGRVARGDVATEITRCRDVLARETGGPGKWFRPSGVEGRPSAVILEEAGAAGYATVVGFDADPKDYADPGADAVASRVARDMRAGSIVSLHLGHAGTVAAFERVVGAARAKGLTLVTVRDLLA